MIPLYIPDQVREFDSRTIASGTSSLTLMGRAAGHLARTVQAAASHTYGLRVLFVCGKGNNAGDGIAAARRLRHAGADARVVLVAGEEGLSDDAAVQLRRYRRDGGREQPGPELDGADVVVDCLLGTGASGAPREPIAGVVRAVNAYRSDPGGVVVACDLPTGVDAETGDVPGDAVHADVTLSLGAHKVGLWLWPARGHCGDLAVADIGIAPAWHEPLSDAAAPAAVALEGTDVAESLPPWRPGVDKRGRGVIAVLAGSPGMSGAAIMVGRGALRMGAGLLTVATSVKVRDLVAGAIPEALTLGLPDDDPDQAFELLSGRLTDADVLAIGPGLGRADATFTLVRRLVKETDIAIVLDADGLNAYRHDGDALRDRRGAALVVTPHAREFARLLGKDVEAVWPDRLRVVGEAARRWGATVVAKGPGTIVESASGGTWVNPTGSVALATGGTGDVLTGMIASAVAAGPRDHAVAAAVYVHGRAGEIAARRHPPRSVAAMDVAAGIPAALASLEAA